MALVDIIALIEDEASKKASSILEKSQKEIISLTDTLEKELSHYISVLETEEKEEISLLKKRSTAFLSREERILLSVSREEILESVFLALKFALETLSGKDLEGVFLKLLLEIPAEKGHIVVLGKRLPEMKESLLIAKKDFSLEEDSSSQEGGFIFKGQSFEMDFSFSSLVKEIHKKKAIEIFKELF